MPWESFHGLKGNFYGERKTSAKMLCKGLSAVKTSAVVPAALHTVQLGENTSSDLCGVSHGSGDLQRGGRPEGGMQERQGEGRERGKREKQEVKEGGRGEGGRKGSEGKVKPVSCPQR